MSTFFFKTNISSTGTATHIKPHLDKLENTKEIEHWRVHLQDPDHVLEIETKKMTAARVKDFLLEVGVEAHLTRAPRKEAAK